MRQAHNQELGRERSPREASRYVTVCAQGRTGCCTLCLDLRRCPKHFRSTEAPEFEVSPQDYPLRFGVPRIWLFGGSISLSNSCVNIAAAKKATARSVSLPTLTRLCRTGVGSTNTLQGPTG